MSWDDKTFMARGLRVRHKYKKRRKCHGVCERCGVKRRVTSSGYEYYDPKQQPKYAPPNQAKKHPAYWTSSNPPCAARRVA